ncbi:hypothetical protein G7054_g9538 [Neopestalotiopsis clavispora]|nr:hypothetical protein G7054_g9538 [Neopestalotiopsis clavispora]
MTGFKYLNQAEFLKEPYQPSQTPARDEENSNSSATDSRTRSGSFYQQSNRSRPSFSMFRHSNESRSNTSLYGQSNQSRPNLSFLSNDGDSPSASVRTVDHGKSDKGKKRATRDRSKTIGAEASSSSPTASSPISPLGSATVHERAARATRERLRDVHTPIKVHSRLSAIMDKDMPSSDTATVSIRISELPDTILISRAVRDMAINFPDSVATFEVQFHPGLDVNLNDMSEAIRKGQAMPVAREISADMVVKADKPLSPIAEGLSPIAERSSSPVAQDSPSSIIEPTFPVGETIISPSKRRRASTKSVRFSNEDKVFNLSPANSNTSKEMLVDDEDCAIASDDEDNAQDEIHNKDQNENRDKDRGNDETGDEDNDKHEEQDVGTEDRSEISFSSDSDAENAQEGQSEDNSHSFILPEFDFKRSTSRFSSIFANDEEAAEAPAPTTSSAELPSLSSPTEVLSEHGSYSESQEASADDTSAIIPTAHQQSVPPAQNTTEATVLTKEHEITVTNEQSCVTIDEHDSAIADVQNVIGDYAPADTIADKQSDDVPSNDGSSIIPDTQDLTAPYEQREQGEFVAVDGDTISEDSNDTITAHDHSAIIADEASTASDEQNSVIVNASNVSQTSEQANAATETEARDAHIDRLESIDDDNVSLKTDDFVDDDVEVSSILGMIANKHSTVHTPDNGQTSRREIPPRSESPTMGAIGERDVMVTIPPLMPRTRQRPDVMSQHSQFSHLPRFLPPTPAPSYPVPELPREASSPASPTTPTPPLRLHQRSHQDLRQPTRNLPIPARVSRIPAPGTSSGLSSPAVATPQRPVLYTARSLRFQHEDSPRPTHHESLIPGVPTRMTTIHSRTQIPDVASRAPAIPPRSRMLRPTMSINDMATTSATQSRPSFAQRVEEASYTRPSVDMSRPIQNRVEVHTNAQVAEEVSLPKEEAVPIGPTISRHIPKPKPVVPQPEKAEPSRLRKIATRSLGSLASGSYRNATKSHNDLRDAAVKTSDHPLPYKKWLYSSEAAVLQDDLSRGYDVNSPNIRQRHQMPMPIPPSVNSRTSSIGATDNRPASFAPAAGMHSSRVPRRPAFGRSNVPTVADIHAVPDSVRLSQVIETDETTPKRGPTTPQTASSQRSVRPPTPQASFARPQQSPVTPQAQQQQSPVHNVTRQLHQMLDNEIMRQRSRPSLREEIASSPLSARTPDSLPRRSVAPTPPRRIPTVRRSTDTIRTVSVALPCGHTEVQHRSLTDEEKLACGVSGGGVVGGSGGRRRRGYGERQGGRDLAGRVPRSATVPAIPTSHHETPGSAAGLESGHDRGAPSPGTAAQRSFAKLRSRFTMAELRAAYGGKTEEEIVRMLRRDNGSEDEAGCGLEGSGSVERPSADPFSGVPEHSNILYSASAGGPRDLVEVRAREEGGAYDEDVSQLDGVIAASTPRGMKRRSSKLRSSKSVGSLLSRLRRGGSSSDTK